MRGRRALTVRIAAAMMAGLAAISAGLMAPGPRLWAQDPGAPVAKPAGLDPALPTIPGEPDPNPLPPAKPAPAVATAAAFTPEGTLADPEGAAKAFVERSQKEADEAVVALSKEADALRARLQKVEAGLARWQAVKESLGATVASRPAWRPRAIEGGAIPEKVAVPEAKDDQPPLILAPRPPSSVKPPEAATPTEPSATTPQGAVRASSSARRGD